ncbi:methyl-accepting chemotaxis protein [Desulfovibrio sp. TomC]|uniref:methyl-accepting chemotaxis protein n=1 Tax=Desulfovibrio sp. TomC TaxID=1562888 RepID=UPI00057418FE|nr:methyl-accepting chemotaxis protein [Desulfovibrio sp. TomC]KHK01053.1 Methyl-accepting chemotaxis protein [Desulfovibrio sp. TomC]
MRKASVNTILTLLVAFFVTAAIVILVVYVSRTSFSMASGLQENALAQLASSTGRTLDLYLEDAADVARALATQDAVVAGLSGDPGRSRERFRNYIDNYSNYWAIFSFDLQGKVVSGFNANKQDMAGGDRSERDYVRAVLTGKDLFFTDQVISAKTGDILIFVMAKAVRSPDGKLLGGVAVCPKWNVFTKGFVDPLRFGTRGYALMLDGRGTVIANGMDKDTLLKDLSGEDFVKQALTRKEGIVAYNWKGERKVMAVAKVGVTGWLVCMTAYESEMTAAAAQQRNMLLLIGALCLAAAVAGIALANRTLMLRPLAALGRYAQAVTAGDLGAPLAGLFRFELRGLADNVQAMVAELKNKLGFAQGVLAGIPAPCAIIGPDSRTLWINRQAIDLLALDATPESAKGQITGQLFFGDPTRDTVSQRTLRERQGLSLDIDFHTRQGRDLHLHVDTTPFYDMDGELLGCLVFWTDLTGITAQKNRIEEQNALISSLAAQATEVARSMARGAADLSEGIEQASLGARNQSSRVHETATAVEQLNDTILEVARNAGSTAQLAEKARNTAEEGAGLVASVTQAVAAVREEVQALTATMDELDVRAKGIGTIMNVISDIADQTNLLALNAAIEAARAGEAGRGFAVVADEVRKLAEKTMLATKDVGQAITGIQHGADETTARMARAVARVADATGLAERSGVSLTSIVELVAAAGDQVRSIAAAAEEQSSTTEAINLSVGDINALAAAAADTLSQSAAAVRELAELANNLNVLIDHLQQQEGSHKTLA